MTSVHDLPPPVAEAINEAKVQESTLFDLGGRPVLFEGDPVDGMPSGEIVFDNAKVVFYRVGSEWEIDIITSNGGAIGFDVPIGKCGARTAEQIAEAKLRDATMRAYPHSKRPCAGECGTTLPAGYRDWFCEACLKAAAEAF